MARAGPSRSQRAPQPTQPRPTNGRRSSRAQQNNDEDEEQEQEQQEEDGEEGDGDDPEDADIDANGANKGDELTRKANDLVRLALFTEHKRTPLRRDEINKKGPSIILGDRLTILITWW
jgi:melanoma-associated antigen